MAMPDSRAHRVLFVRSLIAIMLAVIAVSVWLLVIPPWQVHRAGQRPILWQDYSSDRLAQLLAERRNVLLMTFADWDISSAYPSHMIDTPRVRRAIASREIVPILVNMSISSPETDALREFYEILEHTFPFAVIISGDSMNEPVTIVDWPEPNDDVLFRAIEHSITPRKPSWE